MQSLYLSTILSGAIVCLLAALLVFLRRKSGERSRVILACIIFFSVLNYIPRYIEVSNGVEPQLIISVPMLLLALFMVVSYILYPIEVISPGYLNSRRVILLYSPLLLLFGIYALSRFAGVIYPPYHSLLQLFPEFTQFHAWFRLFLALLVFSPVFLLFAIPYTRGYNNTDRIWMLKYIICFSINTIAYMIVLMYDPLPIKILYYYVSVGCSLYIAYMELYERLIEPRPKQFKKTAVESVDLEKLGTVNRSVIKQNPLCERIVLHMLQTCDFRNPDITLNMFARALFTNRTTLASALHELGYTSFSSYINTLRIEEFIRLVHDNPSANYQDVFYDVGFRSRTTALRNFKQYTGNTPSEYFAG